MECYGDLSERPLLMRALAEVAVLGQQGVRVTGFSTMELQHVFGTPFVVPKSSVVHLARGIVHRQ